MGVFGIFFKSPTQVQQEQAKAAAKARTAQELKILQEVFGSSVNHDTNLSITSNLQVNARAFLQLCDSIKSGGRSTHEEIFKTMKKFFSASPIANPSEAQVLTAIDQEMAAYHTYAQKLDAALVFDRSPYVIGAEAFQTFLNGKKSTAVNKLISHEPAARPRLDHIFARSQEISQLIKDEREPVIAIRSADDVAALSQVFDLQDTNHLNKSRSNQVITIDLVDYGDSFRDLNFHKVNMSNLDLVFLVKAQHQEDLETEIRAATSSQSRERSSNIQTAQYNKENDFQTMGTRHSVVLGGYELPSISVQPIVSSNPSEAEIIELQDSQTNAISSENLEQRLAILKQQTANSIKSQEQSLIDSILAADKVSPFEKTRPDNYRDLVEAYVRIQAAFVEKGVTYLNDNKYLEDTNLIKNMIEFNLDLKYNDAFRKLPALGEGMSKSSFLEDNQVMGRIRSQVGDTSYLKLNCAKSMLGTASKACARDFVDVALMKSDSPEDVDKQLTAFQALVRNHYSVDLSVRNLQSLVSDCDGKLRQPGVKALANKLGFRESIAELKNSPQEIIKRNFSRDLRLLQESDSADNQLILTYQDDIRSIITSPKESLIHGQTDCSDERAMIIKLFEGWCAKNFNPADRADQPRVNLQEYVTNVSKALESYNEKVFKVKYPNLGEDFVSNLQSTLEKEGGAFASRLSSYDDKNPMDFVHSSIPTETFKEYLLAALPDACPLTGDSFFDHYIDRTSPNTSIKDLREFLIDLYLQEAQDSRGYVRSFLASDRLENLLQAPKIETDEENYKAKSRELVQDTFGEFRNLFTKALALKRPAVEPLKTFAQVLSNDDVWSAYENLLIIKTEEKIKPDYLKIYERLEEKLSSLSPDERSVYKGIQKILCQTSLFPDEKKIKIEHLLGNAFVDVLKSGEAVNVDSFFTNLQHSLVSAENDIFASAGTGNILSLGDVTVGKAMDTKDKFVQGIFEDMISSAPEDIILQVLPQPENDFIDKYHNYPAISNLVRGEYARLLSGTASEDTVSKETLGFLDSIIHAKNPKTPLADILKHVLAEVSFYDQQLNLEDDQKIAEQPIFKTLELLLEKTSIKPQGLMRAAIVSDILQENLPGNSLGVYFNLSDSAASPSTSSLEAIVDFKKMTQDLLAARIINPNDKKIQDFTALCNLIDGSGSSNPGSYKQYEDLIISADDLKHFSRLKFLLKLDQDSLPKDDVNALENEYWRESYTSQRMPVVTPRFSGDVFNDEQRANVNEMISKIKAAPDKSHKLLEDLKQALGPVSKEVVKSVGEFIDYATPREPSVDLPDEQRSVQESIRNAFRSVKASVDLWGNHRADENIRISKIKVPVDSSLEAARDGILDRHFIEVESRLPSDISVERNLFEPFRFDLLFSQLKTSNSSDSAQSIQELTEKFLKVNLADIFTNGIIPENNPGNITALVDFLKSFDSVLPQDFHDKGIALSSLDLRPSIQAVLDTPVNKIKNQMQAALETAFAKDENLQLPGSVKDIDAPEIQFYLEIQKLATEMRSADSPSVDEDINNAVFRKLATYINQAAKEANINDFNLLALRDADVPFLDNLLFTLESSNKALDRYFTARAENIFGASLQDVFQPSSAVEILDDRKVNGQTFPNLQSLIDAAVINLLTPPTAETLKDDESKQNSGTPLGEFRIPENADIRKVYIEVSRDLINSKRANPDDTSAVVADLIRADGAFTQNIKTARPSDLKAAQALLNGQYIAFRDLAVQVGVLNAQNTPGAIFSGHFNPLDLKNPETTLSDLLSFSDDTFSESAANAENFIRDHLLTDRSDSELLVNKSLLTTCLRLGYEEAASSKNPINSLALISLVLKNSPDRQAVAQNLNTYLEAKNILLTTTVDGGRIPYLDTASTHTKLQAGIDLSKELSGSFVGDGFVKDAAAEAIQSVISSNPVSNRIDPEVQLISNNYPSKALTDIITKSIFGETLDMDESIYQLYKDSEYNPSFLKQTETIFAGLNKLVTSAVGKFKFCPDFQDRCAVLNETLEDSRSSNLSQNPLLNLAIKEEMKLHEDDPSLVKAYVDLCSGFNTKAQSSSQLERTVNLQNLQLIEEFKTKYYQQNPQDEYDAGNPAYLKTLQGLDERYSPIVKASGNVPTMENIISLVERSNLEFASIVQAVGSKRLASLQAASGEQSEAGVVDKEITGEEARMKTYVLLQQLYRENPAFFEERIIQIVDNALLGGAEKAQRILNNLDRVITSLDKAFRETLGDANTLANFTPLLDTYKKIKQEQNQKLYS